MSNFYDPNSSTFGDSSNNNTSNQGGAATLFLEKLLLAFLGSLIVGVIGAFIWAVLYSNFIISSTWLAILILGFPVGVVVRLIDNSRNLLLALLAGVMTVFSFILGHLLSLSITLSNNPANQITWNNALVYYVQHSDLALAAYNKQFSAFDTFQLVFVFFFGLIIVMSRARRYR